LVLERDGVERYAPVLRQAGAAVYEETAASCEELVESGRYDLALFASWQTAEELLGVVRRGRPDCRVVVDVADLQLLRDARRSLGVSGLLGLDYGADLVSELNIYAAADGVLTASEKEAGLINDLVVDGRRAFAVPDFEDMPRSPYRIGLREGIAFVGGFDDLGNVAALEFLCQEVLPAVRSELLARHPVTVVGAGLANAAAGHVDGLDCVRVVGWVPSLAPYIARSRITVVPFLHGAGASRRVVQALTVGTPSVATSIAIEGLPLEDGQHLLVADDAQSFARSIERLLTENALWRQLERAGRSQVRRSYSVSRVRRSFVEALEVILSRACRSTAVPEPADGREWRSTQKQRKIARRLAEIVEHQALPASTAPSQAEEPARRPDLDAGPTNPPPTLQMSTEQRALRLIAFYLPQFHPIPENNDWWGEGFTEWTNVTGADPLFSDHYQPHLPGDLGFYDLRLTETRIAQAEMAREYGIAGFCWYHFWFHGKRLLERPFDEVLASGEPDFPFCLCWANEPWSRRWHGREEDVLQSQTYSKEDDLAHIRWLIPVLADHRAVRIDGRPIFSIYQGRNLPDPRRTIEMWREEVTRAGLPDPFLLTVETAWDQDWDATVVGFDAKVIFRPQFSLLREAPRLAVPTHPKLEVYRYEYAWPLLAKPPDVTYPFYETVCPRWDNSPRIGPRGVVLHDATPEAYGQWLTLTMRRALQRPPENQLVFINAWNEWGEGAHLEPDRKYGRAFLEATASALSNASLTMVAHSSTGGKGASSSRPGLVGRAAQEAK
jgi:hypothetical protein